MNEYNFTKPTTGDQVLNAAPPGTGLYLYSTLASDPREPVDVLLSLRRNNIILYQNPRRMNSGHWVTLSFRPETAEVFFFSSYGGRPDREKMEWLPPSELMRSGQFRNVLNDGLKQLALSGWTIHYNDYPFQKEGDHSATCGIWAAAFLNSGLNPDEFASNHLSAKEYFKKYFTY